MGKKLKDENNFNPAGLIMCLIIATILFVIGFYKAFDIKKINKYEQTTGIINSSDFLTEATSSKYSGANIYYRITINYSYEVNNIKYSNIQQLKKPDYIDKAKYNKDSKIDVYYNPLNPSKSILVRSTSYAILVPLFGFGLISLLIGITTVILYFKEKNMIIFLNRKMKRRA